MGHWAALFGDEKTDEEIAALRAEMAEAYKIEHFTCDDCLAKKTCDFAYDPYNTNGDCMAEK